MIDLKNIKAGMFIRHDACLIYFEVKEILGNMVVCANRDPKKKEDLVFVDKIVELVEKPLSNCWIKCNREKGFYDKFHPEGWKPTITEVVAFEELKENNEIITEKGLCKLLSKNANGVWKMSGGQKTLSRKGGYVSVLKQREIRPDYSHLCV